MNPRVPERRHFRLLKEARIKAALCEIRSRGFPKIQEPRKLASDACLGLCRDKPALSLPEGRMGEILQNAGKHGVFQQPAKKIKGITFSRLFSSVSSWPPELSWAPFPIFSLPRVSSPRGVSVFEGPQGLSSFHHGAQTFLSPIDKWPQP